jgi:hypothetical protein
MKNLKLALFCLLLAGVTACKKKDSVIVAPPQIQVGKPISNSAPLTGTYKGTMIANQTFTTSGDITVNAGDTLLIQKGVTINMAKGTNFLVNGILISLGTKDAPVRITYQGNGGIGRQKAYGPSTVAADSAYAGGWGGIYCSNTCKLLVIKWTHLDFGGAGLKAAPFPAPTQTKAGSQYILFFENPNGVMIFEDSWIYGSPDDATRFYGGAMNIMRNTFEKCGGNGGDGLNAKGSSYGNMAYNLIIGSATNGTKTASDGTSAGPCQFTMYNNTYVNDGFRNTGVYGARSGSIEVENASRVLAYNNLIADCDFGLRIAGGPGGQKVYLADTTASSSYLFNKTAYGYNFYYVDNVAMANQIVPTSVAQAVVTHPQATDIPNMATFLTSSYVFGFQYDGTSFVGKNNPMFVNYPLPAAANLWVTQASVDSYNFHLKSNSPAAGKGTTNASLIKPITAGIPVDPNFGSSELTLPGGDMGCFQLNGNGNQH